MWACLALVALSANPSPPPAINEKPSSTETKQFRVSGSARSAESDYFSVQSLSASCDALVVAERCEAWRRYLQIKWLGAESTGCWNPRCVIVIHAARATYRAAIGQGGEQTFGSSLIDSREGRICSRRIDLLVDAQGIPSALGHELTHVVLADAFPDSAPPAWANEGAAILADSAAKQGLHKRDFHQSFRQRTVFHSAELLALAKYPSPHRIPAFYGQSASLIAYLSEVGSSDRIVPFVKDASELGYDAALRQHFNIQGVADLHRRWLNGR